MNREENTLKAVELSGKVSEELRRSGGFAKWRQQRRAGELKESLCDACDKFAGWVADEAVQEGDCADTQAMIFQGAWVYYYRNHKDWIQWDDKVNAITGKYDYSPYNDREKLLNTEGYNEVTSGKDLNHAIQRFLIHKQLEGETDGELTIERIERLIEQLDHCKKSLKRQRKELTAQ